MSVSFVWRKNQNGILLKKTILLLMDRYKTESLHGGMG